MTRKLRCIATIIVAFLVCAVSSAQAIGFNFSYLSDLTGDVLSGMLEGDVQADNDTVIVSAVNMAELNGAPVGIAFTFVDSLSNNTGGTGEVPRVSFSGTDMDLIACDNANCDQGFLLVNDSLGGGAESSFGFDDDTFVEDNWSLTAKNTAIPEPATWILLSSGLFGMSAYRRWQGQKASQNG